MTFNLEIAAVVIFIAVQLMTWGALRQQVKNLDDSIKTEKIERQELEERVRDLEIAAGPLAFSKKTGG